MEKMINGTWLTIEQTAEYLHCSVRFLRDKAANREIPLTMFGGKALFNTHRIDEWLLSQEQFNGTPLSDDSSSDRFDTMILADCNRERADELVQQLINFNEHFVTSLGRNLQRDLRESNYATLTDKVYAQLSRWCHPNRDTRREKEVKPMAHELSMILFGRLIPRVKHVGNEDS